MDNRPPRHRQVRIRSLRCQPLIRRRLTDARSGVYRCAWMRSPSVIILMWAVRTGSGTTGWCTVSLGTGAVGVGPMRTRSAPAPVGGGRAGRGRAVSAVHASSGCGPRRCRQRARSAAWGAGVAPLFVSRCARRSRWRPGARRAPWSVLGGGAHRASPGRVAVAPGQAAGPDPFAGGRRCRRGPRRRLATPAGPRGAASPGPPAGLSGRFRDLPCMPLSPADGPSRQDPV
jgi:hypothetical protein